MGHFQRLKNFYLSLKLKIFQYYFSLVKGLEPVSNKKTIFKLAKWSEIQMVKSNILVSLKSYSNRNKDFTNLESELKVFEPVWTERTFSISNISLVITYVTLVVAAVMLAGFIWVAFAFSGTKQAGGGGYGYGYDEYTRKRRSSNDEDDDEGRRIGH